MSTPARPLTVLIAAMGGEGGGVLTAWLVEAATATGLPVQSTSIPGVAQRTGATTYYVELWPEPVGPDGREPIFALYPTPGDIDLMVASELLEAGRAIRSGYVAPGRTTLIASAHRVFAIGEKTAMADGRIDDTRIRKAARDMARTAILADFAATAQATGAPLNAVLLGAIAGSGRLPIPEDAFRDAIRASGKAVARNLAGFDRGLAAAEGDSQDTVVDDSASAPTPPGWEARIADYPAPLRIIAAEALPRLTDYQDRGYAELYLERLDRLASLDPALAAEAARHLALWMCFEDVIRVAQLKIHPERVARIRAEIRARDDEPVRIAEFLKPGPEELAAILPPVLARRVLRWAERDGRLERYRFAMEVRTDTVWGFLRLRALAGLKPWRRRTHRFMEEQEAIEEWLAAIRRAVDVDRDLAAEVVACARLLKGYGDTYRRGRTNFRRLFDTIVAPVLDGRTGRFGAAEHLRRAREAALADPSGRALDRVLERTPPPAIAAQ